MSAAPSINWTPQRLANALRGRHGAMSRVTLWRACRAGDIPHTLTPGGHMRIDPAYVARVWPDLVDA